MALLISASHLQGSFPHDLFQHISQCAQTLVSRIHIPYQQLFQHLEGGHKVTTCSSPLFFKKCFEVNFYGACGSWVVGNGWSWGKHYYPTTTEHQSKTPKQKGGSLSRLSKPFQDICNYNPIVFGRLISRSHSV